MNLDFGTILGRAWRITWNNKILWLFGILAGLGGGSNANFRGNVGNGGRGFPTNPEGFRSQFPRLFGDLDQNTLLAVIAGLICVGVIIGIALFVLSIIGRGGLIGGIRLANSQGRVTFGEAWAIGVAKFWTVLLIGLIVAVISFLVAITSVFLVATICFAPLACVGFLLVAVLGVYTLLAQIAAVAENLSVMDALRRAWEVIRANLAGVVVLGLILVVIQSIIGAILAAPFLLIIFPAMAGVVLGAASESQTVVNTSLIVAGLCFLIYLPILIVLSGILQTWFTAAWTLAYDQLSGKAGLVPASPSPAAPRM